LRWGASSLQEVVAVVGASPINGLAEDAPAIGFGILDALL
jgi:hypothetical protein